MLKTDFYTVHELQSTHESMSCSLVFNQAHSIFNGHFPGQPVVPGVCMIQIVRELLEQQFDMTLRLRSAAQVKFLRLITPADEPVVHIEWKETAGGYAVNAGFKLDADLFKLSAIFEQDRSAAD